LDIFSIAGNEFAENIKNSHDRPYTPIHLYTCASRYTFIPSLINIKSCLCSPRLIILKIMKSFPEFFMNFPRKISKRFLTKFIKNLREIFEPSQINFKKNPHKNIYNI
jgi:hypothetical protein